MQLVAAVGMRVLVYDAVSGKLEHSLKGHKGAVHCVSYSSDGKRFASGGADKQVIIWTSEAEGILKYAHTEPIQAIAYNPMTHELASATAHDFGLWSAEARSVPKHKLPSRALCCAWTSDGQFLAIGLFRGGVSIRDRNRPEQEKVLIEKAAPVWSLQWSPSRAEAQDVLAVSCWDQAVSFHTLAGPVGKPRALDFDPCCVSYFENGEYLCVGGSNRAVSLWTKDGVPLAQIASAQSWVWTCKPRPRANYVAVGTDDGTIAMYQLQFERVHALHGQRYASRDNMTDVVVRHLQTDERVRIRCREHVLKLALYKDRLAVQLPQRLLLYELAERAAGGAGADDADDAAGGGSVSYVPVQKLRLELKCEHLLVLARHVLTVVGRRLQLLDLRGALAREWELDAPVAVVKPFGGERGREGVLVGLRSGAVVRLFVDNPFPTKELARMAAPVRALDLSADRARLAVVDEDGALRVVALASGTVEFSAEGATSCAWNADYAEMLCWAGHGSLHLRTADLPVHSQPLEGLVVGFEAAKIACLHNVQLKLVDVPQAATLHQFLERADFAQAARVACLGVTEADWRLLGAEALRALHFDVARQALTRVQDLRALTLLHRLEAQRKARPDDDRLLVAEVLAHQGKYAEAARHYVKAGRAERAVQMYADLRQWDEAKALSGAAGLANSAELAQRQAEWAEETRDWRAAADTYLATGDALRAIKVVGEQGGDAAADKLAQIVRSLPAGARDELALAAAHLKRLGALAGAREAYARLGDTAALVALAVEGGLWDDAIELARAQPSLAAAVYLPYADWLATRDEFAQAQEAYRRAQRPDKAVKMLEALAHNATVEQRYADGSYYLHLLALERLRAAAPAADGGRAAGGGGGGGRAGGGGRGTTVSAAPPPTERAAADAPAALLAFASLSSRAELYSAYARVHRFSEDPFTTELGETIFHACRYLLARTGHEAPFGLSRVAVLAALAKQAKALKAYKLARHAHDKLAGYRLPPHAREQLDLQALTLRAKPFADADELLSANVCYRCQTANPLLNAAGDECVSCKQPFVRSFVTFETLPLVQFELPHAMHVEVRAGARAARAARCDARWAETARARWRGARVGVALRAADAPIRLFPFPLRARPRPALPAARPRPVVCTGGAATRGARAAAPRAAAAQAARVQPLAADARRRGQRARARGGRARAQPLCPLAAPPCSLVAPARVRS
jgi:intraflagellar transport protein 122